MSNSEQRSRKKWMITCETKERTFWLRAATTTISTKLERHPAMKKFELGKFKNRIYPNSVIKCFSMVQREGVCHRVNNLAAYMIANSEMSKTGKEFGMYDKETTSISKTIRGLVSDSIPSENIVLWGRVTITKSAIGPNTPGQDNPVKIIDITESIVCLNATVAQGAQFIIGKSFATDGKTYLVCMLTLFVHSFYFSEKSSNDFITSERIQCIEEVVWNS